MTKSEIIAEALAALNVRIAEVEGQIVETEKSQAEDSKSSAGDKFETGRERLQQELDRLGAQLQYLREQRVALEVAGRAKPSVRVGASSYVLLSNGAQYLVAVGYGKLKLSNDASVFIVSPESPIGEALMGKQVGDSFVFRESKFAIERVE